VWAGTDANGAAVSEPPSTVASSVTFDDAPSITSAARGSDGAANPVVGLTMSEPVVGTYDVDNWQVVDSAGTYHAVASVSGSGSGFWKLTLARSPAVAPGTLTVRYAPGDLHDRENSPLPPSTVTTT
jgi:hypothetical protein